MSSREKRKLQHLDGKSVSLSLKSDVVSCEKEEQAGEKLSAKEK